MYRFVITMIIEIDQKAYAIDGAIDYVSGKDIYTDMLYVLAEYMMGAVFIRDSSFIVISEE